MARPPTEGMTERETQIMEVLWRAGAASAERIRQELPDDPHDSTVRTLLRILENKGYVKHVIRGKVYVYRPAVRKASAERKVLLNVIKRFFGGSAEALVLRLIEDEHVTPEQLEHLKERANATESKHRTGEKS